MPFEQIGQSAVKRLWRQKSEVKSLGVQSSAAFITPRMSTAVVSDLHLGKAAGHDLLRRGEIRERLLDRAGRRRPAGAAGRRRRAARGADRVGHAQPPSRSSRSSASAFAGKPVTLLCGNHDYQLAAPLLERTALDGGPESLTVENTDRPLPDTDTPTGRIATWLEPTDFTLAYPGLWIRPDVYATHGHYMDWHGTVPTIEVMAIGLAQRVVARKSRVQAQMTPADYEAALAPVYELAYTLAQSSRNGRQLAGGGRSVDMWERLNSPGAERRSWPGAPRSPPRSPPSTGSASARSRPELSAVELRRAGLRSIGAVVGALGIDAEHVIFGHTHRSGPWPRDDASGWRLENGGRLWNSGSWVHEPAFLGAEPEQSPYFPGVVTWVDDDGPPRLERLLDVADLPIR